MKRSAVSRSTVARLKKSGQWMVRTFDPGLTGHDGFRWGPLGTWTNCPRWSSKNTKADCTSGGLFGQSPTGWGYAQAGAHIGICETGKQLAVDGNKVKTRRARIIALDADALRLLWLLSPQFGGSLDLRGCTLPEGFTIGEVGGWLYLSGCTLPEGFTIGEVGGSLDLRGCTLPEGFTIGEVGGTVYQ